MVTPVLGTPTSGTLTNCTGLPVASGVSGFGTGVATALAVNVGSAGAFVTFNGALGTPSSGTVTNLTGTASININGTVGATTPTTASFTSITSIGTGSHTITNNSNTELLIQAGLANLNVLAVRNTNESGYSAYTVRNSVGEQMAIGYGNSTTAAFWAGWNYIESWNGTLSGTPPPFQIAMDGDYGGGWNNYRRMSFDSAGSIRFYKLESGTSPTACITIATTGLTTFSNPIGIGVTAASNAMAFVSGAVTATAAAAYGFVTTNTYTAAANSDSLYSFAAFPTVAKGAFTGLSYYGFRLGVPAFTGAGTLANYYGLWVDAPTDGTNRYGLKVENIAGGTTNYALHTGTGVVRIGDSTEATTGAAGSLTTLGGIYSTKKIITATDVTALGVVELGHASDTTLSRSSAGVLAVEGVVVPTVSSTNTLTNKTYQLAENAPIILDDVLSADGTYSGITQDGTAGTTLAFGDLVYLAVADSRWELADADAESTSGGVLLGMCVLAAAADGNATSVLLFGKIRADAAFPTFTIGAPVYAGTTAGDVQVAQPSGTDDVIRVLGHAVTADAFLFNPDPTWITHT